METSLPTNGTADGNPVWSPGGDQLAFSSNRESDLQHSTWHIYTVAVTGGTPTKISSGDQGWAPSAWGMVR
ncbi:MAG TPA: hypothetical protein VF105_05955 [Gemmatimonadaceae bacterium]